uniref:BCL6 corepressor n=1 Tax=Anabas testudineus TaxID=64144 RepID=A0A7N6AYU1_ANATE
MKDKSVDSAPHQPQPQSSPVSTAVEVNNRSNPASGGKPSVSSPSPKSKASNLEISSPDNKGETHTFPGKQNMTVAKPDTKENTLHFMEKGNTSSQIFDDSCLPPGFGYTNCYIPYSVAENLSLQHMTMQGKGPVYPHPVLLGSSSFYPPHIAPKHSLSYGVHPYQNSQEATSTPMSSYPGTDAKDQLELRSKSQDKPWIYRNSHKKRERDIRQEKDKSTNQSIKVSCKNLSTVKDDVICIDLVRDEADDYVSKKDSHPRKTLPSNQPAEHQLRLLALTCQVPPSSLNPSSLPLQEIISEEEEPLSPFPDIPEEHTIGPKRETLNPIFTSTSCVDGKKDLQHSTDTPADEDEGPSCSKNRRSGLTKRIANSSGYVGDRIKCTTTELYADSSKLSREQKALQVGQSTFTFSFVF